MKSLNKSTIAVFVFGVVYAHTANAAAFNVTSDQDNITIIGTQGAGYDLNKIAADAVIGLQTANDATTKADTAQAGVNANSQLISTLNQKVDDNKAVQTNTDNNQNILIDSASSKADTALQGVATNGQAIIDTNTKVDKAEQDALNAGALADTADKKADTALQGVATNGQAIINTNTKVDKAEQDALNAGALADTADKKADTALQGVVKNGSDIIAVGSKADKAESDALLAGAKADAANTTAVAAQGKANFVEVKADNAQSTANTALTSATDANAKADANTNALTTKVDTNTFKADQDRQDQALHDASNKATQAINTGTYAQSLAVDAQTVAAANKAAVANVQSRQQAQEATIQNHSAQLKNHEERITALENESNNNFQNLKDDVDNNRKRAAVGVASVAAMSNIPQVTDSQTFAIGAGVGGYDSQGAVAIGISARVTDHIVTKASVGAGSFGGATYGAGVSFGF